MMSAERFYRTTEGQEIEFDCATISFKEPSDSMGDVEENVVLKIASLIDAMRKEGYTITHPADKEADDDKR